MFLYLKKMRADLLEQGKLKKYLWYAIGEIVLIVAGILIALSVNNENAKTQALKTEHQYYHAIKSQLGEDKQILNDELSALKSRISDYHEGSRLIADDLREQTDALAQKIYRLMEYGDFRRKSSVYQTLVSSGEINLIKNKQILTHLQELERAYQIIERLEAIQAEVVVSHTAPAINELLDFESRQITSPEQVFTTSFKNRFFIANRLAKEKQVEINNALTVIDKTIDAIDLQLNVLENP